MNSRNLQTLVLVAIILLPLAGGQVFADNNGPQPPAAGTPITRTIYQDSSNQCGYVINEVTGYADGNWGSTPSGSHFSNGQYERFMALQFILIQPPHDHATNYHPPLFYVNGQLLNANVDSGALNNGGLQNYSGESDVVIDFSGSGLGGPNAHIVIGAFRRSISIGTSPSKTDGQWSTTPLAMTATTNTLTNVTSFSYMVSTGSTWGAGTHLVEQTAVPGGPLSIDAKTVGGTLYNDYYVHFALNDAAYPGGGDTIVSSFHVKIDKDKPTIVPAGSGNTDLSGWLNAADLAGLNLVYTVSDPAIGQASGISAGSITVKEGSNTVPTGAAVGTYNYGPDIAAYLATKLSGTYTFTIAAQDVAGNTATPTTFQIKYDKAAPSAAAPTVHFAPVTGDAHFDTLNLSWTASTEAGSGLKNYEVSVDALGTNNFVPVSGSPFGPSTLAASIPLLPAYRGNTIRVKVAAVDNAGNRAETIVNKPIPALFSASLTNDFRLAQTTAIVDIDFGVPLNQFNSTFAVVRYDASVPGVTLPYPHNFFNPPISGSGNLTYSDAIPIVYGVGNKTITYKFYETPAGESTEEWVGTQSIVLPNHAGSVTSFAVSGSVVRTGTVLQFQGLDYDQDTWAVELDENSQDGSQTPIQTGISYASPYNTMNLTLGTLTAGSHTYVLKWTEPDGVVRTSNAIVLTFTPPLDPGLNVVVNDVTTTPGKPVNLSATVSEADASGTLNNPVYQWQFDDGTTSNVANPVHVWHQIGDSLPFTKTLSLTVTNDQGAQKTVSVNVTVVGTVNGTLSESETWTTATTVTGNVVVPSGATLTIAGNTTVSFEGHLGSYNQGITVQSGGTLVVGNGARFDKASGQAQGWGTITVLGTASIGSATIQNASQAIAAGPGSNITLTGTTLQNNGIALHVVGNGVSSPAVTVNGATITNNTPYGVKEDSGGRPVLKNTTVLQNKRNYYSWDGALLTIDQINALPGNTPANIGE